ncbi:hypothetical protein Sfulv_28280 [Streptomyces fulvorobeus]|uniref:Uncharacterized protein n=1 Tax=Streptomyces fulvorobeus TaxID=284028 RepID=A0A7J0C782_9ACTN|nr:hypothetical protein [Streptomyces fulvorobeus]GFM98017.1 hypothetical protein Sfulv_28280 [Streptomyces fulvorobeus]
MYKRMLRSALAASFVAALGFGLLSGGDIAWGNPAASAPTDIAWSVEATAPGDIAWSMPGDGDIAWSAPAPTGA